MKWNERRLLYKQKILVQRDDKDFGGEGIWLLFETADCFEWQRKSNWRIFIEDMHTFNGRKVRIFDGLSLIFVYWQIDWTKIRLN